MGAKELGLDLNSDMLSNNLIVSLNDRITTPFGENLPVQPHLTEGWVTDYEQFPDLTENEDTTILCYVNVPLLQPTASKASIKSQSIL